MSKESSLAARRRPSLFVWRDFHPIAWEDNLPDSPLGNRELPEVYASFHSRCPFCGHDYLGSNQWKRELGRWPGALCHVCGFSYQIITGSSEDEPGYYAQTIEFSSLREIPINDRSLELDELGAHLRRQFDDIYSLDGHRVEELIGDVARRYGFGVRFRAKTHDGGIDIVLLENASGRQIIVQCKCQPSRKPVVVDVVRSLLGVATLEFLRTGEIPTARLVALPRVTRDAREMINEVNRASQDYKIELVEAGQLLQELQIYNKDLPPLETVVKAIARFGKDIPSDWIRRL